MTNLNEMKTKELKEMAKELKVANWWNLKKADLITEIAFAIADREEAGEDVDVAALAAAETEEPKVEEKPEVKEEPEFVPMPGIEKLADLKAKYEQPTPKRGALIEFDGKAQNICAWGKELGISPNTLYGRIYKMGWTVEKAFTTPARKAKQ